MPARTSVCGVQMMMQTLDQGLGGPDAQVATTSHQLDIKRGRLERHRIDGDSSFRSEKEYGPEE